MHQVGGETPLDVLGAHLSKPVYTTWCPCPPGQTRMRYDGTSSLGVNPYLTAKLGARKKESGVDLVNIALIGELINELLEKGCPIRTRKCMGLIITHTGHILDYVNVRTGYVMLDGMIVCEGDPHEILATIKEKGYEECAKCVS